MPLPKASRQTTYDWMYLIDDEVMLNRAVMSKWGFRLGEITLSFQKLCTPL